MLGGRLPAWCSRNHDCQWIKPRPPACNTKCTQTSDLSLLSQQISPPHRRDHSSLLTCLPEKSVKAKYKIEHLEHREHKGNNLFTSGIGRTVLCSSSSHLTSTWGYFTTGQSIPPRAYHKQETFKQTPRWLHTAGAGNITHNQAQNQYLPVSGQTNPRLLKSCSLLSLEKQYHFVQKSIVTQFFLFLF